MLGGDQITIRDAIVDLPQIEAGSGAEEQDYPMDPQNDYQRWVRGDCTKIYNHVAMETQQ